MNDLKYLRSIYKIHWTSDSTAMTVCARVGGADLLELLDLGLVKHGKDVGGGSLATLLGVLLASCPCSTLESGGGNSIINPFVRTVCLATHQTSELKVL